MDTTDTTLSRPARDQAPPSGLSGPAPGFRPDIQALRAIAVGLVVIYHAGVPFVSGGYIGVDVFFVISGFLITQHLIGSMQRETFGFGSFYVKRARRILPAALTVVVLTCLIAWAVVPKLELQRILEDAVATALYVPNVFFWIQGTDYLSATEPSVFQHYWSLGIEEQFYLVWPVLIYLVYRFTRGNPLALKLSVSAVVLVSFVACVIMTQQDRPSPSSCCPPVPGSWVWAACWPWACSARRTPSTGACGGPWGFSVWPCWSAAPCCTPTPPRSPRSGRPCLWRRRCW
ncbi:acyltransferase [Micrococcus terreus]|uniref:acyltransferase family protein n=1 Tax=Micrococcus terreus TaxID=574650 RepID=UPI003015A852